MAQTPKVLKNFNLFVNGTGLAGLCEEVRLPDFKVHHEEHRAGGMDSPMAIDLGMERMELGFTMSEHSPLVFGQFGLINQNAVQVTFRAAQVDDINVLPYTISARGMYTEQRSGSMRNGSITKLEATISLRYYKLTIGQVDQIEIDVDNMVRSIQGTDQLQAIRAAIGL